MQGDVDLSSLVSFGEHRRDLLADGEGAAAASCCPTYLVMTDAIGSTETRHERHPLRAEGRRAEGRHHDGAGRRPTPSCSTTTSTRSSPASGKVGRVARGGNIPLGYYNDPGEDRGDVRHRRRRAGAGRSPATSRRVEADGRITLLGRGSVSINSGGEKIYPEEVEGALKSHPDVFDVLVVGVPDERWGERVTALLQPRAGPDADARRAAGALPRPDRRLQGAARAAPRRRGAAAPERQARLPLREDGAPATSPHRKWEPAGRVPARTTHGELGGTGLRGWLRDRPPPTPRTCSG